MPGRPDGSGGRLVNESSPDSGVSQRKENTSPIMEWTRRFTVAAGYHWKAASLYHRPGAGGGASQRFVFSLHARRRVR